MEREALKLALEALENMCNAQSNPDRRNFPTIHDYGKAKRACIAIKEALAQTPLPVQEPVVQPAQEPVAIVNVRPLMGHESIPQTIIKWKNGRPVAGPLYTAPPQREWAGLNEKERNDIEDDFYANISIHVFDAIEAKLKEKNT